MRALGATVWLVRLLRRAAGSWTGHPPGLQQPTHPASKQVHFQALGRELQEVMGEAGGRQRWSLGCHFP